MKGKSKQFNLLLPYTNISFLLIYRSNLSMQASLLPATASLQQEPIPHSQMFIGLDKRLGRLEGVLVDADRRSNRCACYTNSKIYIFILINSN